MRQPFRAVVTLLAGALTTTAATVGMVGTLSSTADAEVVCTVDDMLVNSCRPWFGASSNRYPEILGTQLNQFLYFEQRTGRQMDIAHTYHPPGDNALTETDHHFATRADTYLMTNWALARDWASAAGADEAVNAQIDEMAASIKTLGDKKIFLTLSHEPEDNTTAAPGCTASQVKDTASSGTSEDYRAMWANVRARFDAAGVANVVWVMNYMGSEGWDCMVDDLYPGDDLVDWIVFNAYQHGDRTKVDFASRVGGFYDLLTARSGQRHDYLSKPWGIVEWGIHNSSQDNAKLYYAQAKEAVESGAFPKLRYYLVFDNGNATTKDFSHRVAYDTAGVFDQTEQDAFNLFARSPALVGDGVVPEPPPDLAPPGPPGGLSGTPSAFRGVDLSWWAAEDDIGVASYDVVRDGVPIATVAGLDHTDLTAQPGSSHVYTVRATDTSGKVGEESAPVSVTLATPDVTAPSRPTAFSVTLVGGRPRLAWSASTDNVGVTSYDVLRNGVRIATPAAGPFVDETAPQGRSHTYRVRARDGAGNVSALSASISRNVPDTTAPSAPSLTAVRDGTRATLTWTRASDNVAVTGYVVQRGTTQVARVDASTTRYVATGLRSGTRYTFRVIAVDGAGNRGVAATVVG
jgi:hypothetical protein